MCHIEHVNLGHVLLPPVQSKTSQSIRPLSEQVFFCFLLQDVNAGGTLQVNSIQGLKTHFKVQVYTALLALGSSPVFLLILLRIKTVLGSQQRTSRRCSPCIDDTALGWGHGPFNQEQGVMTMCLDPKEPECWTSCTVTIVAL